MSRTVRMYGKYKPIERIDDAGLRFKTCKFCGTEKFIVDFPKNGVGKNGEYLYRDDCKTCYNIRRRENKAKKVHTDFIGSQKRRGEALPELSHQEWKECLIYFGGECAYCGCTTRKGQRLTKDHLEPISQGGRTVQGNIVPACASCNSSKGSDEWRTWYMKQPFFSQDRMNAIFKWRTIMQQVD